MSWEHDYSLTATCPCGKGRVLEYVYSDDWNRHDSGRVIECPVCSEKYHFEVQYVYHSGKCDENVYLVENGQTINIHFSTRTFSEDIAHHYLHNELQETLVILKSLSSAQKAKDTIADYAIKAHKSRYKTVKLAVVVQHVSEALDSYYALECNKENELRLKTESEKVEKHRVIFHR